MIRNLDPKEIISASLVNSTDCVFFLGNFDNPITIYIQQVRALNLADALCSQNFVRDDSYVAVIGGGVAGLTLTAALALSSPKSNIVIYEKEPELLQLQRGARDRFVHPHVYEWPDTSSRNPVSGLPIMAWRAQDASGLARVLESQFNEAKKVGNVLVRKNKEVREIKLYNDGSTARLRIRGGGWSEELFDVVIIAVGFGLEKLITQSNPSYWSPSLLPAPILSSERNPTIFVSGTGDGGLTDFIIAAFSGLSHSDILKLVMDYPETEGVKNELLIIEDQAWTQLDFDIYQAYRRDLYKFLPKSLLRDVYNRLRLNTTVWLHTRDKKLFRRDTALINRFIVYLIVEADQCFARNRIHLSIGRRLLGRPGSDKPIRMRGRILIKPDIRLLRFGPNRTAVMKPFRKFVRSYLADHPTRQTRPITPRLTASAATRWNALRHAQTGPTSPVAKLVELPPGWSLVRREDIAKYRSDSPPSGDMVMFFNGEFPKWRTALARGVQPRSVVESLVTRFRSVHAGASLPKVMLLESAGSEGKSTALLQTVAILLEDGAQSWSCVHREASAAPIPADFLGKLPNARAHAWIVLIDDADNIAHSIRTAVERLAPRTDIHLLLAARDAEWQLSGLSPVRWYPHADFKAETLGALDLQDARRIVGAWQAWGPDAMGLLKDKDLETAAMSLLSHAKDLAARKEEPSLLGALLLTRMGEDLIAHVRKIVHGLGQGITVGKFTMRQIYALIAAMHEKNQLYLTRSILACALGCEVSELDVKALAILRREAMLDAGGNYVLTRHRSIAEAACAVLREDGEDIDAMYPFLARAAATYFRNQRSASSDRVLWIMHFASYFVDQGERWWPTARGIVKAIYEADHDNPSALIMFSSVHRRTGKVTTAMEALKGADRRLSARRNVLSEWVDVAMSVGDLGLAAWLCGRSLADMDAEPLDPGRSKPSLLKLGATLELLFRERRKSMFVEGQIACGKIGLRLSRLDIETQRKFETLVVRGGGDLGAEIVVRSEIDKIGAAVALGSEEFNMDNDMRFFDSLLGDPELYRYFALFRMAGGDRHSRR
jgi:hypothetical protein